jgi:Spy/CpxP family protein refolding chaperone
MMKNSVIRFAGAAALATGMLMAQTTPAPTTTTGLPAWLQNKIDRAAIVLDLDATQKGQLETIAGNAVTQARSILPSLKSNRAAMQKLITSGGSSDEIQKLAQAQGALIGQLIGIRAMAMQQAWSVLRPAQQQKALQLHEFGYGGRAYHGGMGR